jgi:hypothetical protein
VQGSGRSPRFELTNSPRARRIALLRLALTRLRLHELRAGCEAPMACTRSDLDRSAAICVKSSCTILTGKSGTILGGLSQLLSGDLLWDALGNGWHNAAHAHRDFYRSGNAGNVLKLGRMSDRPR